MFVRYKYMQTDKHSNDEFINPYNSQNKLITLEGLRLIAERLKA